MKLIQQLLGVFVLLAWVGSLHASIHAFPFDDPAKEKRFKQLSEELRCLVCQNQNLADSNAELALDLRKELYRMVKADASDEEIKNFMVSRYGDFVLYNPPVKTTTYLLWFGPFVFGLLAVIILIRIIRRQGTTATHALSTEEQQRARQLLAENKDS